jgi:hypothetical protein
VSPKKPDPRKDRPDPKKPVCNASYRDRWGQEKRCKKRGYHLKHGQ